jgi:hypothetical protein
VIKKKNQKTDKIESEINQKNWTMKKNLINQLENPKKIFSLVSISKI